MAWVMQSYHIVYFSEKVYITIIILQLVSNYDHREIHRRMSEQLIDKATDNLFNICPCQGKTFFIFLILFRLMQLIHEASEEEVLKSTMRMLYF